MEAISAGIQSPCYMQGNVPFAQERPWTAPDMSTTSESTDRPNPAPIQVIGVGMARTGTTSLWKALEILGFGPGYHPMQLPMDAVKEDFFIWADIIEGKDTSPAAFDKVLRGYKSVMDSPIAVMAKEAYAAYPNAKYILTVRDTEEWEHSLRTTVLEARRRMKDLPFPPDRAGVRRWFDAWFGVHHKNRLATHPRDEYEEHNERIKSIIPPDQLLIYDVKEGWDRLVEFLGVSKPDVPFPYLNKGPGFFQKIDDEVERRKKETGTV